MRYIRTKDGELGYMNELGDCYFKTWMCNHKSILKEDFKYADTIEELIDLKDLVGVMWHDDSDEPFEERYINLRQVIAIGVDDLSIGIDTDDGDFDDYSSHIVELYIKQPNGDYKLVAKKKTEDGKLELL